MTRQKLSLSIQAKITLLIISLLTISLCCYLIVGRTLFVDDKTSYIYDYSLQKIKSSVTNIEQEIRKATSLSTSLGTYFARGRANSQTLDSVFQSQSNGTSVSGLLILQTQGDRFNIVASVGAAKGDDSPLAKQFKEFALKPSDFGKAKLLIKHVSGGQLLITGIIPEATTDGSSVAFLTSLQADSKWLESEFGGDIQAQLIDPTKQRVLAKPAEAITVAEELVDQLVEILGTGSFKVGARDWTVGDKTYIVGYQYIFDGQLLLVTLIDKSIAFKAVDVLVQKSLFLGISIMLISIGISALFARGLTSRLRQMWEATKKVATGDFSMRVDAGKEESGGDEVVGLARSFNSMSEKITELMAQTAEKARMEKELETAKTVQKLFFPVNDFKHENLLLVGKCIAASECSGDWWHYSQVRDELYVVIGDVTGHGVSAALMTASAHSVFSMYMEELRDAGEHAGHNSQDSLARLAETINDAIAASGGGQSTMTCLLLKANLNTGAIEILNADHRPPYHCITENGKPVVKPLIGGRCSSLGGGVNKDKIETLKLKLSPNDALVLYTDGLLEGPASKAANFSKTNFIKSLGTLAGNAKDDPTILCKGLINSAISPQDQGKTAAAKSGVPKPTTPKSAPTKPVQSESKSSPAEKHVLDDDVTVVVLKIPSTAKIPTATVEKSQNAA